jgi:hypothetical protein
MAERFLASLRVEMQCDGRNAADFGPEGALPWVGLFVSEDHFSWIPGEGLNHKADLGGEAVPPGPLRKMCGCLLVHLNGCRRTTWSCEPMV